MSITDTVLMIRPQNFGYNAAAALTNSFQQELPEAGRVRDIARTEFEHVVEELQKHEVEVIIFDEPAGAATPDAVFPNNWFSTHPDGSICTYPMLLESRRNERRAEVIDFLVKKFSYKALHRLEYFEKHNPPYFLEGTGSVVFDHQQKKAFAALSPRTSIPPLLKLCEILNYEAVAFTAYGPADELIYHTNVLMCIGESFAVIGLETLEESDRERISQSLTESGKEILVLNNDQIYQSFAGNMLQLRNKRQERLLLLSESAYQSLSTAQLTFLKNHNEVLIPVSIPTIEKCGGGSVRCMLAEIFY